MSIRIAVVDDHSLFRKGLINLIHAVDPQFKVELEAANGKELMQKLEDAETPDLVVLDYDMPIMNGYETTLALRKMAPQVRIMMLTMKNDEHTLIRMLRAGVNGYLSKDVEPEELKDAIYGIQKNGFHYTDGITGTLIEAIRSPQESPKTQLNDQEMRFLNLACSELTYREIADKMCLSEKTIDGYRAKLFDKLHVKSRVGLVIYAVKNELISI